MQIKHLILEISPICSFLCDYCYFFSRPVPKAASSEFFVDTLRCFRHKFEGRVAAFSGGEALLCNNIFELMALAKELGLCVVLASNGATLNDEVCRDLKGLTDTINISYDGPSAYGRYSSGREADVVQGIHSARRAGIEVLLHCTVTAANRHDLPEILRLAEDIGACGLDINSVVPNARTAKAALNGQRLELSPEELDEVYENICVWIDQPPAIEIHHHIFGQRELRDWMKCNRVMKPLWVVRPDGTVFPMIDIDPSWCVAPTLSDFNEDNPVFKEFLHRMQQAFVESFDLLTRVGRKAVNPLVVAKPYLQEPPKQCLRAL